MGKAVPPNKIRVRYWPEGRGSNPYIKSFAAALRGHGVEARPGIGFTEAWLQENGDTTDYIHVHWPEMIWRHSGYKKWMESLALIRFDRYLRSAKRRGIKIVWTMHNLRHHEGASLFDVVGYKILLDACDLVIVHSAAAKSELIENKNPECTVLVMQHGNYCGHYPEPQDRHTVLESLGFTPDLPLISCLGLIRDYKGVDTALEATRLLDGKVQLLIAGRPYPKFDIHRLDEHVRSVQGIKLVDRLLTSQEYADFATASDLILLPYKRITGSGVLLSALTFGRCAVASDLPFFREASKQLPGTLNLFETGDAESMARSIVDFLGVPHTERRAAAESARDATMWSEVVRPVVDALASRDS